MSDLPGRVRPGRRHRAVINRVAAAMPAVAWPSAAEIRQEARSGRRRRVVISGLATVVALVASGPP